MLLSNSRGRVFTIGLLAALSWVYGSSRAEAGLGIIVTDTVLMPVGDPLTQYDFKLSLAAGNQLIKGDNITFLSIPNYDGFSSYVFRSGGVNYSNFFSILTTPGTSAGLTNIELVLTASPGSLVNTDLINNLPIGDLIVETNVEFPPASNSPLLNPINYITQTHLFPTGTPNSGAAFTATPGIVPEPSSLALLGVGISSVAVGMARRRRRSG